MPKKPGRPCTICHRADVAAIDELLRAGSTAAEVARRTRASAQAMENHRAKGHVAPAPPTPAATEAATEPVAVQPIALRTPEDVLGALEWAVAETRALLGRAKHAGNLSLQNALLKTCIEALDKLAKSSGLYSDGAKITVTTGETKVLNVLANLSTEQLRAMKQLDDEQILALVASLGSNDAG